MIIRPYTTEDIEEIVVALEQELRPFHYGKMKFSADKVRSLLTYGSVLKSFHCEVVIDNDGKIAGGLAASVWEYAFSYEAYAEPYTVLIAERARSLTTVTTLVRNYVEWARSRKVREIRLGQSSGFKMNKFDILAKRLGFTKIGSSYLMEA